LAVLGLVAVQPAHAATLYWSSTNTWDDGTTSNWGTLSGGPYTASAWVGGSDANFEGTAGTATVSGTIASVKSITFATDGYTLSGSGTITMTGAGGNITTGAGTDTISSAIAGSVGLTKAGTGTLVLSGANTYTGGTTVSAGTLQANHATALGNGGNITFSGGTLQFTAASAGQDWGARIKNSTAGAVALDTNTQNVTFAGAIDSSNTAGLTKTGAGTLTLSSAQSYTGATLINSGTLKLQGAPSGFQYYKFTPTAWKGGADQQLSELQFFLNDTWTAATTVTAPGTNSPGGEQPPNANDNNTGSKWYTSTRVALIYDFFSAKAFNEYNWATANDSTGRDPIRWKVEGSTDGITWAMLDDKTAADQSVTDARNTWVAPGASRFSGWTLTLPASGSNFLPVTTAARINSGAILDLNGTNQQVASLADAAGGGGTVENGNTVVPVTLTLSPSGGTTTFTGVIAGGGGLGTVNLVMNGTGTQVLAGSNTYTGTTTVNGGTLEIGVANALPTTTAFTLANAAGAVFSLNGNNQTIGSLSGGGGLGGNVTLGAATLTVGGDGTSPAAYAGVISGTGGALTKTGLGTLTLSGANTYTGATAVNAGALDFAKRASLYNDAPANWTPTNITVESGATLAVGVGANASGYFDTGDLDTLLDSSHMGSSTATTGLKSGAILGLDTTNAAAGTFTRSTAIGDLSGGNSLGLAKIGAGTLILSGTNTYSGATIVSAGTLKAGSTAAFGTNSSVTLANIAGAVLDITGFNNSIGSLTGGGGTGGNVTLGAATLTVGGDGTSPPAYAGVISGTGGALTKLGGGTQTLSGANTYTGGTTVNAGTLRINATNSLPGTVTINSPGILNLNAGAYTNTNTFVGNGVLRVTGNAGNRINLYGGTVTGFTGTLEIGDGTTNVYVVPGGANGTTFGTSTTMGYSLVRINAKSQMYAYRNNFTCPIELYGGWTQDNLGQLRLAGDGPTDTLSGPITLFANSSIGDNYGIITGNIGESGGNYGLEYKGITKLAGNSTYSGVTSIGGATGGNSGGTVVLGADPVGSVGAITSSPIGTGGLTFAAGGTASLYSDGTTPRTILNPVTFNNNATLGDAANNGKLTFSADAALGGATRTLTLNSDAQFDGIVSSTGAFGITKAGAGTLTLSGANTYTGLTTVSAGKLILSGDNSSATGGMTVSGGAAQFDTTNSINGGAYNVLNRDVTVTSPGAVVFGSSFGATNIPTALANRIVASSNGAIAADNYGSTDFDFNTPGLTAASFGAVGTVTYTGTLTPYATAPSVSPYRLGGGGGRLIFTPASYDNTQDLILNGNGNVGTVDFGGLTKSFGVITFSGGTTQNGTLTGASYTGIGGTVTASLSGSNTFTNTSGTTTLNANNSGYSGAVNVTGGTLKAVDPRSLGTGTVTLNGGDLSLANDGTGTGLGNGKRETLSYGNAVALVGNRAITVGQYTASGMGTVFNAQNKTLQLGTLSIGAQTLTVNNNNGFGLGFTGATTLTDTPTFSVGGGSNAPVVQGLTLSGVVSGAYGITKSGGGTLVLTNSGNTFGNASTITISGGLMSATSNGALGNSGNIISLNASGAGLQLNVDGTGSFAHQINTTTAGGVIDVTQFGTTNPTTTNVATLTTAFNGGLSAGANFTKSGNGILEISADNITGTAAYTGVITVNAGAIRVSNAGALGAAGNNTVVANNVGAAVQINGVSTGETFNISNTGLNTGGAIENVSGANNLTGLITLDNTATVGSTSGTLNIKGGIAANASLTFAGAGNITVNTTAITGTTATQTKIGSGTLEIQNADPLTGNITVNAGTLKFSAAGTTLGNLTVNPGATLTVDNTASGTANRLGGKTLTLSGATFNFIGNSVNEAVDALTPNAGLSTINLSGTGGTLSFASLGTRAAGGVVNFTGSGPAVRFAAATTVTNGILVGGQTSGAYFFGGNNFATSTGGANAPISAYAGYNTGNIADAAATDNMNPAANQTGVDSKAINTLKLSGGVGVAMNPGQTLTLGAGGLINNGGGNVTGGSLTTTSNTELIANYATAGSISSIISGTTGGLTKVGAGNLTLTSQMTYTGQTTVNQGALTLGGGNSTLAVNNALVVNNGGTLALGTSSQYVGNLSSAGTVEGSGGIITGAGGTLAVNQATDATFAGSIQGSVNLVKTGDRTLTLTSANTTTGTIAVIGGLSTLRERSDEPLIQHLGRGLFLRDGGTLPNATGITVRNATLNLDNTGTKNIADRVNDAAPITLDNGTIRYVGRSQTNSTETLGPVTASGFSSITMLTGGSASATTGVNSATLTLTSLTRNSGAMIQFNRGTGSGTPLGQIGNYPRVLLKDDDTSGLTFSNNTVVGMVSYMDNANLKPVGYVPGLGFGSMGTTGFPNNWMPGADGNGMTGSALATASPTTDFMTGSSQVVKLGGQTVNSYGLQANGKGPGLANNTPLTFQAPGDTLTIASGWLALWFRRAQVGDPAMRGAITSGQSELFLHGIRLGALEPDNVNYIHSVIKDNGANSVKFVMSLGRATYLTAPNTYTGGTVANGMLVQEWGGLYLNDLYLNGNPGTVVIPNATNPAQGLVMNSANVTMLVNQGQIGSTNIATLNGSATLTLVGNNTLAGIVFNSNGGTTTPTVNPGGTLTLNGNISSTPSNVAVTPTISGGFLDFAGATRNITVDALSTAPALTGLDIISVIQNGGFNKKGAGVLNLTGANTYAGGTTVSAGTLLVNNTTGSGTGSGAVTVNSSGILSGTGTINGAVTVNSGGTLSGTGTINGTVNVNSGGILAPGASAGTLTINNSLVLADGSVLEFELNGTNQTVGGGVNDLITNVTDLTLGGTLNITELASFGSVAGWEVWRLFDYTGALTDNGLTIGTHPTLPGTCNFAIDTSIPNQVNLLVPEPATLALLGLGGLGVLLRRKRR
jgi:autotransporter-associated beta strand protein